MKRRVPDPNPEVLNNGLIDKLVANGHIVSESVEAAFRSVLRHHFVPEQPIEDVYQDRAIATKSIDNAAVSSSSQPTMMAIMLEQLELQPGHRVLEIGAGTGFNAALMAHIVNRGADGGVNGSADGSVGEDVDSYGGVTTIDIDQDIIDDALVHLASVGYGQVVEAICADGGLGWPDRAPFDRIILTVGAGDITPAWWDQLAEGGILVLPLELASGQMSVAFEKVDGRLISRSISPCGFIRLRGAFASEREPQALTANQDAQVLFGTAADSSIDKGELLAYLQGPSQTHHTDVAVTPKEAWDGLGSWLLLREPEMCLFIAVDGAAQDGLFPALSVFRQSKYISTAGLISHKGLALAFIPTRPEQEGSSPTEKSGHRFNVMVRQFGSDDQLMPRLVQLVQEWHHVGRPATANMQLTAYPKAAANRPTHFTPQGDGLLIISKKWTEYHLYS